MSLFWGTVAPALADEAGDGAAEFAVSDVVPIERGVQAKYVLLSVAMDLSEHSSVLQGESRVFQ